MASWYNTNWRYRKKLTVPAANVAGSGAISGIPLFFDPSADADILAQARPDGHDILFTSADGATKLPHELLCEKQFATKNGGWSWFARPRAVYSSGKSHIGSVNPSGVQQVTQYTHSTKALVTTAVNTHTTTPDDHCNPSLLIRGSDGRPIVFYPEAHNGALSCRIATNVNDSTAWGSEVSIDPAGSGRYAYPSPHELGSTIWLLYRDRTAIGPNQEQWGLVSSVDGGSTWGSGTLINALATGGWGTRPYCVSVSNGSRIDLLFSTDSPDLSGAGNQIRHCYFDGTNWFNSAGVDIGDPTFDTSDFTLVHDGGSDSVWVGDIAYDSNGRPHVLFYVYVGDSTTNHDLYHGTVDGSGAWTVEKVMDESSDGFKSGGGYYPGVSCLDPADDTIIWAAKDETVYEIQKWKKNPTWAKLDDITTGSTANHGRPVVVKDCPVGSLGRVVFLSTSSYVDYDDFGSAIAGFPAFGTNFRRAYVLADVDGATDTDLYVYYGNANATDQQDVAATWADYLRVYHSQEHYGATPGIYRDACGTGSAITYHQSTAGSTGPSDNVGEAWEFNGTSEAFNLGNLNFQAFTAGSLECFANYDSGGTDEHMIIGHGRLGVPAGAELALRLEATNDTVEAFARIQTGSLVGGTVSTISVIADTWHYLFAGWSAAGGVVARVDQTEGSVASTTGTSLEDEASNAFMIGAKETGAPRDWLDGFVAEARVPGNRLLSKDQTDTQFDNWSDGNGFFAIAAREYSPTPLIGAQLVNAQLVNRQLVGRPLVGFIN